VCQNSFLAVTLAACARAADSLSCNEELRNSADSSAGVCVSDTGAESGRGTRATRSTVAGVDVGRGTDAATRNDGLAPVWYWRLWAF
jgi:hypothetical protein